MSLSLSLSAQTYNNPYKELRSVFGGLTFQNPYPGQLHHHLYDMSPHIASDDFYFPVVGDTSNATNFFYLYEAMYYAAKDTNNMMPVDTLIKKSLSHQSDTVPILFFNYSFLQIRDTGLKATGYFLLDTANNKVLNHPSPIGNPYLEREIFAAGMPADEHYFTTVTYRIDPNLLFFGPLEQYKKQTNEGVLLKIDFGDGNGWITFNQAQLTHHNVQYPQAGSYPVKVALFVGGNPINSAIFKTTILSSNPRIAPDFTRFSFAGYRASFFNGCSDGTQPDADKKFVIYLEGIDVHDFIPFANRNASEIYDQMIKEEKLVELRNFGYTFVVVDWNNSRRDIRHNAMALVELLDYLKCTYPNSDHEFVVIGESMGGLVARYALTFMESDDYQDGYIIFPNVPFVPVSPAIPISNEPCSPELMHKTRLFITFDTPHQGANIPLAYQELYKVIANGVFGGFGFSPLTRYLVTDWADLYLGSTAAQQMLIYHVDIKEGFSSTIDEWYYYPHPAKEDFFNDLSGIGNYPRYCKLMALSNGSLTGNGQTRPYNGALRTANDILLQFNGDIYARVLHFVQIPVFGLKIDLRTNPDGYGKVLGLSAGTWGIKVKLFWFGVKVNVGLNSLVYKDIWAANTKPWCTEAGGLISIDWYPGSTAKSNQSANGWNWLFGLNWKSQGDGNGHYSFDGSVGIPFVAQAGVEFDIYTDGMHFNFIPTASALDWGNLNSNSPLSLDLQNMAWPQKMNSTPFNVISGIAEPNYFDYESPYKHHNFNRHHLNVENQILQSNQSLTNCNNLDIYVLNSEIGDEVLWLNNRTLPWKSRFESELEITVNPGNNNPHYEYATGGPQQPATFQGFYSKSKPFAAMGLNPVTSYPFEVTFKQDHSFNHNQPLIEPPTEVNIIYEPLWICCIPADRYKSSGNVPTSQVGKQHMVHLSVNPNPFAELIRIEIELPNEQLVRIDFYNSIGNLIWSKRMLATKGISIFELPTEVTLQGLYLLRIQSDDNEVNETFKLIRK